MRDFSDLIFASEFQAPHLDLFTSMSDERFQEKNSFCSRLMSAPSHVVDLIRVSIEVLGKVRHVTAFDQLPENADHNVN
jgi:hypothetical protein